MHDPKLLDQLENRPTRPFQGAVFRALRGGLDPLTPSTRGGRWAPPGGISVLYTSLDREGAIAEVAFHWSQLTPWPAKPLDVHEIAAAAEKTLRLIEADLPALGVNPASYKAPKYRRTQEIGAVVEFLGCDGLIVPSARWNC